ncbi:hypothetical protein SI65_03640 [Aspergillus cristatus]|uniref:Uncharacterized protein n=1 Tax=Aspergillus cristatus TaxID=573508 RepID=A0A1E3BI44_ASPCR|nr:hypothetical protein SI65_03640 [Aspergillus cristatus]
MIDPKNKYNPLRRKTTTLIDTHIAAALSSDYDFPYDRFHDTHVMGRLYETMQKDYDFALKTLYNRTTFQIHTLEVFKTLRNEGFVAEDALRDYINATPYNKGRTMNVQRTRSLLRCFDIWIHNRFLEEREPDIWFDDPIWLAVAIIRSPVDYTKLFEYLTESRILGKSDSGVLLNREQCNDGISAIAYDPKVASQREEMGSGRKNQLYGYVLPSGVGEGNVEEAIDACLRELDGHQVFAEEYFGGGRRNVLGRGCPLRIILRMWIDLTEIFMDG